MSEKTVHIINAFTAHGKHGNPAGVVLDSDGLSNAQMLSIAQQVGLSETAFVSQSCTADRRIRFFTTTHEVDLCGHATIASWSLLRLLARVSTGSYTQQTMAGNLAIIVQDDLAFMQQAPAVFGKIMPRAQVAALLGIAPADLHPSLRPQMVSTGLKDLMVPVRHRQVLEHVQPQTEAIKTFSNKHSSYSLHVFALTEGDSLASARNFDPAHGIPEECATGTSNGSLLCYLKHYNMLPAGESHRVEQGETMGKLSHIYGKFMDDIAWIGGSITATNKRTVHTAVL